MMENLADSGEEDKIILVIEDEKIMSELICAELADAGYRVLPAYNGKQVINLIGNIVPDLIVLDLKLPDITGFEIGRIIQENPRMDSVPIVVFSSRSDLDAKISSFISGARKYVTKSSDLGDLVQTVKDLIFQRYNSIH